MQVIEDGIKEEVEKALQAALSRKTSMSSINSDNDGIRKRTISVTSEEPASPAIISRQTSISSNNAKLRVHIQYW